MSELREKKKSQDKKHKKALDQLIEHHCTTSNEDTASYVSLDLHNQNLASCHLFFDNFLQFSDSLTSLHLDHNNLNFIPNGILKSLPLLQTLSLHNNQLEALPTEIGELTHLEHIRLDCNSLISLPVELKNCSSLQSLHLSGNPDLTHLPGTLFTNMLHLHHILADHCPLLKSLPASLQHCSALTFVVVDDSCLDPPPVVLAAGYDAIRQYFQPASVSISSVPALSSEEKEKEKHASPVLLNTDTHCIHRDNALRYLELKRSARMTGTDRCERCWHMHAICICDRLPRVVLNDYIELVVYMDSKEVFNAGDDAKLLSIVCPDQTKRFIYAAEDQELVDYISSQREINPSNRVVVLFPSSRAISSDDFISTWRQEGQEKGLQGGHQEASSTVPGGRDGDGGGGGGGANGRSVESASDLASGGNNKGNSSGFSTPSRKLMIIVVDAVWRHARRMAQRLRVLLPEATHVQLTPEQFSVYARKQSQPDRICTVEATALFLSHIGGADTLACADLVKCVRINNDTIRPPPSSTESATSAAMIGGGSGGCDQGTDKDKRKDKSKSKNSGGVSLYTKVPDATHPCWYYGKVFYHTHGELLTKQPKAPKQKRRYL